MRKAILYCIVLTLISCSNNEPEQLIEPIFHATQLDAPTYNYTYLNAEIDEEQESKIESLIKDHGFVWSELSNNSLDNPKSKVISLGVKKSNYAFTSRINNLKGNTTYFFKAFVKMNGEIYYSNEIAFKTKPGSWKKLRDFPGPQMINATSFTLNDHGYIIAEDEVWSYDPQTDSWKQKNKFPITTSGATSFVINNIAYVYCDDIWKYNENNDSWESLIGYPQYIPLHKGCTGISSFVYKDKVYVGGGLGNVNESFLVFDPTSNEVDYLDFSIQSPNVYFASCLFKDGSAIMVGGTGTGFSLSSQVIKYDLDNKTWEKLNHFINDRGYETERTEMISFVVNGELYTGMGYGEFPLTYGTNVGSQDDFYRYDEIYDTWEPQTYPIYIDENNNSEFVERAAGVAFSIGNKGYMGLGENRKYNWETEQFEIEPMFDFWEFTPN